MFVFDAPLFWYKLIFMTELLLAEGFATYTLKKRNRFALRVVLCVIAVYSVTFLFPVFFVNKFVNTVTLSGMFLVLFALTVVALKICYDEKFVTLFFCGIVAYTTQNIAYSTVNFFCDVVLSATFNPYGDNMASELNVFAIVAYFGIYCFIYWFVWAFIEHKIREQEKLAIEPLLLLSFASILCVDIVLNAIIVYYMNNTLAVVGKVVLYSYRLISTLFVYIVLYSILRRNIAENELKTVESLWQQDRRIFEFSRENIDLINIKCHDLKHQIRSLKYSGGSVDPSYISELEKSVTIYDNSIKTGNEALDLLFAENSIFMEKNKIKLSVMAEGEELGFMKNSDIYSLFGNALHNAMESLVAVADEDKRLIRMFVRKKGNMIVIHCENYCEKIEFGKDGLPKTDKQGGGHGYGMRSMRMIAEKYGGLISVSDTDGMFYLDMLIPIITKEERKTD